MFPIICVAFLVGVIAGFGQSLAVGIRSDRWEGGTGILWGLIVGTISAISAIWLKWNAIIFAILVSLLVLVWSFWSIKRNR